MSTLKQWHRINIARLCLSQHQIEGSVLPLQFTYDLTLGGLTYSCEEFSILPLGLPCGSYGLGVIQNAYFSLSNIQNNFY